MREWNIAKLCMFRGYLKGEKAALVLAAGGSVLFIYGPSAS